MDAGSAGAVAPVQVRITTPLIGLHSFPEDVLALPNGTRIQRLWGSDLGKVRDRYRSPFGELGPYNVEEMSGWNYVLVREMELEDGAELPRTAGLTDGFDDVVCALRLLAPGMVRWHIYWTEPLNRDEPAPYSVLSRRPYFTMTRGYLDMNAEQCARLVPTVKALARREQSIVGHLCDRLEVALRRFDQLRERREPADRVVDAWIGLEALVGPRESDGLTNALSRRIPSLLADSGEAPSPERVRDLYRLRCKLLHGVRVAEDPYFAADEMEELLRRAILAWLDPSCRPKNVRQLDDAPD
ncbi:MAG: hypothetical protein KDC46_12490 [Thermoleophilia bacterium]|nr:hypothetical protein [Thermoleophilia bacterium]